MSVLEEMPCPELVERVTEYLDASLLPDDRGRFESHLAECAGCEEILDQFRAVIDLTGRLRVEDVATVDPTAPGTAAHRLPELARQPSLTARSVRACRHVS